MNREDATKLGLGIMLGYVFARVLDVLTRKEVQVQVLPVPYAPATPPPEVKPKPGPQPGESVLLTANPVPVVTGRKYRVVLSVGFPFSMGANQESVRKEAQDLGFTDVKVFTDRPVDFPGSRQGDYYIEARWGGGGTTLARPTIPGIALVEVWEG